MTLQLKITLRNIMIKINYYYRTQKLQVHWKSAIPHKWKRNTILGALHRAKRIATNWQEEVQAIKQSFIRSGYPAKFVNEVINDFENPTERDAKRSEALEAARPIGAGAYPGFCSMKRLEVILLPLDGMLVHRRSLPRRLSGFLQQFAGTHLYTWVERGTVRVKCLA